MIIDSYLKNLLLKHGIDGTMKIDDEIKFVDKKINQVEKEIARLAKKKDKLLEIKKDFPQAEYEYGAVATPTVNDEVTCMKIISEWSSIVVRFHINPKKYGRPIYSAPYNNVVATLNYLPRNPKDPWNSTRKEIEIHDYESLVPANCPRRNKFIKRIKLHIMKQIREQKLVLSDKSFNKDYFKKLILLT